MSTAAAAVFAVELSESEWYSLRQNSKTCLKKKGLFESVKMQKMANAS